MVNQLQQNNNQPSAIAKAKGYTCKPSIHNKQQCSNHTSCCRCMTIVQTIMLTMTLVGQCEQQHPNAAQLLQPIGTGEEFSLPAKANSKRQWRWKQWREHRWRRQP